MDADFKDAPEFDIAGLTPTKIVAALDDYIIGQDAAKKSVAVALRNRWRRQQVNGPLKDEIAPRNILLIGPTGVGKTEISRRLAKLAGAPFLKVEASKFTEVGYVGRDVESMVRDLVEIGIKMVKEAEEKSVTEKATGLAEDRVLDALLPRGRKADTVLDPTIDMVGPDTPDSTREKLRVMLKKGKLDNREIEIEVNDTPKAPGMDMFAGTGMEEAGNNFREIMQGFMPKKTKTRKVTVKEALGLLQRDQAQDLVDMETVTKKAVELVENAGIIFLDEIDKVAARSGGKGPDVSREGVQRDLLPIVEGSTVNTKYGPVKTDHVLFVAAGAFHVCKPSDLIPELQGRFPIRVELESLDKDAFYRILTEPTNRLPLQYMELLKTENVTLSFEDAAIKEVAAAAEEVNARTENIGARRLHTLMERLLEELLFSASEMDGVAVEIRVEDVRRVLGPLKANEDLSRYIL